MFIKTFGTQHPSWSEVKEYWAVAFKQYNPITEKTSASTHKMDLNFYQQKNDSLPDIKLLPSPEKSSCVARINLLSKHMIESHKLVRVVSINQYKKLTLQKLEDHVANRIRDLEGISHLKALRPPLEASIEEITKLRSEQPNMSEAADLILKHLHGQYLLGLPAKLPPMLLVGPPGTGKTRFMRKVAEALKLPFCDISLAGLSDNIKILGLSKYWNSSDAGIIASTLAASDYANPVFMLDEIEKAGVSERGNPLDALLLLLESETAKCFKDEFLNIPMNVSYSSVIATANSINGLSSPLLSRFVILNIPELDFEGRKSMVRTSYSELLAHSGYNIAFEPTLDDDVVSQLAKKPKSGRELKRTLEDSILNALRTFTLEDNPTFIRLRSIHISKTTSDSQTRSIGFT
jgi:ATP-dependent Lon protease